MSNPRFIMPFVVKTAQNAKIQCELVLTAPADAAAWDEIERAVTYLASKYRPIEPANGDTTAAEPYLPLEDMRSQL